ncbi:hypothetical protein [Botrimarina sp.]|uniref:hypothetical protein n=1 Tax=Botrimarina sp. TaxID=2795802 RepID=UPI0032EACDEC
MGLTPTIHLHDASIEFHPALLPMIARGAVFLIGMWVVTYPSGWLVRRGMRSKAKMLDEAHRQHQHAISSATQRGFPDGGAVIGRLERSLIYLFVVGGTPTAIGFLIAAKSVFRFGELSDRANRLEAEYITIGTLMSFAVGLAVSHVAAWLLRSL